jgi:cytochrome c biogenesis protein CcmG/thiol:disulfide interchange protein DsbE
MERTRLRWRRTAVPAALVVVLLGGGWLLIRGSPAPAAPAAPAQEPAPALAGRTLDGGFLDLADLRGSVVVVTVWAAWCAPCRQELPVLVEEAERHADQGLHLVGVDTRDGERQARELLSAVGGDPASSVVDPDGTIAATWDVAGVPETFVVDATGTVRARHLGPVSAGWLDEAVAPLLPAG